MDSVATKVGKGNSRCGRVYVPIAWVGKDVIVSLKEATAEPKEQIKQQKTTPLFNDICPYYLESTSGCKVSTPVGQYVECAGSLLKCPKKA